MAEFFDIRALSSLPTEEALPRKISIRRAWVFGESITTEPTEKKEEKGKSDCSESDGETDPAVRRGLHGEFLRRHRFRYRVIDSRATN